MLTENQLQHFGLNSTVKHVLYWNKWNYVAAYFLQLITTGYLITAQHCYPFKTIYFFLNFESD
jgi:hypothetical protein